MEPEYAPQPRARLALNERKFLSLRVFCYRGVGHRKSAPEYFGHVLEDLGIEADHAVMVGDDFEADVLSANLSGIRAIWFHENGTENQTSAMHRTIHSLSELPEALELLMR